MLSCPNNFRYSALRPDEMDSDDENDDGVSLFHHLFQLLIDWIDDDIVMPDGPPPGMKEEEDSDDDIPMPEGPPPGTEPQCAFFYPPDLRFIIGADNVM
jgi:hypothetical protein